MMTEQKSFKCINKQVILAQYRLIVIKSFLYLTSVTFDNKPGVIFQYPNKVINGSMLICCIIRFVCKVHIHLNCETRMKIDLIDTCG